MTPIRAFRYVAFVEGVTTLALFLIAMPLKYLLHFPHLVPPVGRTHGIAWLKRHERTLLHRAAPGG